MCKINPVILFYIYAFLGCAIVNCEDKSVPSKQNQFESNLVISYHCDIPTYLNEKTTYTDKVGYIVTLDSRETYTKNHGWGWATAMQEYITNTKILEKLIFPQQVGFECEAFDIGFKEAELTIKKLELVYKQNDIRNAAAIALEKKDSQ